MVWCARIRTATSQLKVFWDLEWLYGVCHLQIFEHQLHCNGTASYRDGMAADENGLKLARRSICSDVRKRLPRGLLAFPPILLTY